jgi:hydroxymethylpyrimidine kinase / phosphomethylpyrimidine kinase / thiamine-phosphate diphosphorylase
MNKTIVWTIAGSDSSGGAGIQADLHTFNALGVHGCSVIAALTAQNSVHLNKIEFCSQEMLRAQLDSLSIDLPPSAIKLGMVGSLDTLRTIAPFLEQFPQSVVYDPVLFASVGGSLHDGDLHQFLIHHFLAKITVLTPNIPEAEWLLGRTITTYQEMEQAAKDLQALGPKVILLKGGHATTMVDYAQDYWTDGSASGWLFSPKIDTPHRHGTGCTLASAITATLAQGYEVTEALVLAKAYINQAIRLGGALGKGQGTLAHKGWPSLQADFPMVSTKPTIIEQPPFPDCGLKPLGFYPIVDSAQWVECLLALGVNTLQLRIKDLPDHLLREEIKISVALAKKYQARLFINDYWQYALHYGAYGVHLGQEDIDEADWMALNKAGIRLGVSTHSYYEIARALAYKPSYLACGPIYHTNTKVMNAAPQGLARLTTYCQLFNYPVVAIGGIKLDNVHDVLHTGADSIAVITAITQAAQPEHEVARWLHVINNYQRKCSLCNN